VAPQARRGKGGRRIGAAHLIVSNPPYVTDAEWRRLPPDLRDWEPRQALRGGRDGLDLHRRLADEAAAHLLPGGWIAVEVGAGQAGAVAGLYEGRAPFMRVRTAADLAGIARVVAARKKD
jgi:release factor glutamine methyltransferase